MGRILIVEDERAIADIVAFNLNREGYESEIALDGTRGLSLALEEEFDLILLDVMLPGLDGWEVLKALREQKTTPVIMLTAREEELDKIHGLELGADDYITKPFSMNELKARIKANLRRVEYAKTAPSPTTEGLTVDRSLMRVCKDGRVLELTAREFDLLHTFPEIASGMVILTVPLEGLTLEQVVSFGQAAFGLLDGHGIVYGTQGEKFRHAV